MEVRATLGADGLRAISDQSVVEQVTNELRRSILDGTLAPGQALSLRQLAAQLRVSFIPVREALHILEAQGLVVSERSRSTRVAPLDPAELHSIYRLRIQIEPDISARATLERDDFDRLEKLLAEYSRPELSFGERALAHAAFHLELMHPAATKWDLRVLDMFWNAAQRYTSYVFARRESDSSESHRRNEAHATLLDAARTREPENVREAVREHLLANEKMMLERIRDDLTP